MDYRPLPAVDIGDGKAGDCDIDAGGFVPAAATTFRQAVTMALHPRR